MVISGVNTVTYNGNGSQTAWPFTFPIASASEIKVQLINADGTTTAVENDYYVDVVNNTVYYPGYAPGAEPPEADQPPKVQTGQKIEIYREVPMTQEANLGDVWPYFIIEKGLDKLTMITQQIYSYTNRKLDSALASMFQLAGIVTDSGKLQHITDQYNAIDANAAAAAASEANALAYKNAASASATSASNSATSASNSASSASTTATQLMAYLEDKEELTAPAIDTTLSISGAAADAQVTGNNLNILNSKNLYYLDSTVTRNNITVTPTFTNFNYSIVATSSSLDDFVNLASKPNSMSPFTVNKDIYIRFKATSDHVAVRILETSNGGGTYSTVDTYYSDDRERVFKFSSSAQGYIIRVIVDANNAVNGTFELTFSYNPSNSELKSEVNEVDSKVDTNNTAINAKVDAIVNTESTAIVTIADFTNNGYLDISGAFVASSNTQWTTDYIPVEQFVFYKVDYSTMRAMWSYDSNKTPLLKIEASTYSNKFRFTDNNTAYVRYNINADKSTATVNMYPVKDGLTTITELNNDIKIEEKKKGLIVGLRRPLIAFVLDGDYDLNDTMHDVFANHNTICGFAIHYTTSFNVDATLQDYLDWQDEGFEILSHGVYNIGSTSTLTDNEAIQTIKNSYEYLKANGFDPKGYIGLAGNVKAKYIPEIAKLYEWSATTTNHYGTSESCMFYGADRPYYAWRYSMQVSTLQQQKDAVDRCLANNGLLLFYGHAQSTNTDYFTQENLDALLTYIESVGGEVVTPSYAVRNYFAIRYDDIYNIINS